MVRLSALFIRRYGVEGQRHGAAPQCAGPCGLGLCARKAPGRTGARGADHPVSLCAPARCLTVVPVAVAAVDMGDPGARRPTLSRRRPSSLAEHTRCPLVANMLENSRTTFTTPSCASWPGTCPSRPASFLAASALLAAAASLWRSMELLTTERGYVRLPPSFGQCWNVDAAP